MLDERLAVVHVDALRAARRHALARCIEQQRIAAAINWVTSTLAVVGEVIESRDLDS